MRNLLIIFLIFSFSISSLATYNPGHYGQKDFDLYYGAMDLDFIVDDHQGDITFKESEVFQNYSNRLIEPSLIDFQEFFSKELANSLSCPNSEMTRMYDYLRFVNRVLALSYLYEANLSYHKTGQMLGEQMCSTNWNEVLASCKPKSSDMKLFIKSAKHIVKEVKEEIIPISHSIKSYQASWIKKLLDGDLQTISHYRLKQYCSTVGCSKYMDYKAGLKKLNKSCAEDLKLFANICSESDSLFGLSHIPETYPLIKNSDILEVADVNGFAAGCLRRFKNENQNKEIKSSILKAIFPIIYQSQIKSSARYPQGRLFPAGSLKQFAEKGLTELYKEKKAEPVVVKKDVIKVKKQIEKVDKVEFIDRYVKKKKVKTKKKKRKVVKKKKKEIFKTSFLVASEMRKQMDMQEVKVDMLKFKYDFMFSMNLKKMLDDNLQMYISRSGLEQMRKFDNLGTKEGPMPLMFLKYLIETEKHQSLYNIKSILGERFYVSNDIDSANPPKFDYIEIRNDESTNFKWQIFIREELEVIENTLNP